RLLAEEARRRRADAGRRTAVAPPQALRRDPRRRGDGLPGAPAEAAFQNAIRIRHGLLAGTTACRADALVTPAERAVYMVRAAGGARGGDHARGLRRAGRG